MKRLTSFIEERLGLKVNVIKSKTDKSAGIKYLGFGFYYDSFAKEYKAKPYNMVVANLKERMEALICGSWGVGNAYKVKKFNKIIWGWINYFKIGNKKSLCERLDSNIRYCLRTCIWKHWRTPQNRAKALIKLGIYEKTAELRIQVIVLPMFATKELSTWR